MGEFGVIALGIVVLALLVLLWPIVGAWREMQAQGECRKYLADSTRERLAQPSDDTVPVPTGELARRRAQVAQLGKRGAR